MKATNDESFGPGPRRTVTGTIVIQSTTYSTLYTSSTSTAGQRPGDTNAGGGSGNGYSTSDKIALGTGLGVGLGIGLPSLIISIWMCCLKIRRIGPGVRRR